MIQRLKQAFPNIETNYLRTIIDKYTFILEAENVLFVTLKESWHLHIENKSTRHILNLSVFLFKFT